LYPHAPQEEGDVRVSAVSVARPAVVSGSGGRFGQTTRRGHQPRQYVALAKQCHMQSGGTPCFFVLLAMYTVTTRRDWLRRLAYLVGRLLRCCCCRPAVEQCQPASETDHLRHDVRPTSSCAVLQSIGTCISRILLCLGRCPVDHLSQGWPGVAYSYSTRHISNGQPGAARAETHRETSLSTGRPPTTARAETCATEHVLQPAWPRCGHGQPLSGTMLRRRDRPCVTTKCASWEWECIDA
jgi:hypothetical protein